MKSWEFWEGEHGGLRGGGSPLERLPTIPWEARHRRVSLQMCLPAFGGTGIRSALLEQEGEAPGGRLRHWERAALEFRRNVHDQKAGSVGTNVKQQLPRSEVLVVVLEELRVPECETQ
ncbi:hypothetical protein NDU88_008531 [Pleurodeles waltl]|uniref:Uncharacterized protein n=1 Tax=Pleurodeles waltl TaxID=8319 RepID=A0AAV7QT28_PLEWA|nr:hypothetical protein NDU88_008531 [Pleurodeles waltl]